MPIICLIEPYFYSGIINMLSQFSSNFKRSLRRQSFKLASAQLSSMCQYRHCDGAGKKTSAPLVGLAAALGITVTAVCSYSHKAHSEAESQGSLGSKDPWADTKLYPPTTAHRSGHLQVGDIHNIYYEIYGNPSGKPVLFVHGGPGGGTTPAHARFFDPAVYRIILVDQRGCGKSTPFAELRENTTQHSICDFEKLRNHLGVSKWQVFGGSWGSTLALAYAMEHPDRTAELVLRGIFLLRQQEVDWLYQGPGAGFVFPDDWSPYRDCIPEEERGDMMAAYGRRLRGELGEEEMHRAARAWSVWEGRVSKLIQDPIESTNSVYGSDKFALAFARIENHYFINKGFFPRDGYLLEKQNLDKIRHIPTFIVQGRYDVVCPAVSAYDLHQALPHSEVTYTLTGHSAFEPEIIKSLVKITDALKDSNK